VLLARRFRCGAVLCGRRIFNERFDADILAPWARRTARLDHIVHHLALALGGRPAGFARRLMLPVSNDTLLRLVRRRGAPPFEAPTVVGIDDWAWRRNQRSGTIICDLERRRTIALLPDREPATAQAWLSGQPQIAVVARDRGGGYALAAKKALPLAIQVADRWHLMENTSHAFLAVRKSMRHIRVAIGAAQIDPDLLTAAETIQFEGYLRREETNAVILGLAKDGVTIKEIVRRTGYSRGLARKVLRGHFAYYGVGGNGRRLRWFANQVVRIWRKWLSRRDRQGVVSDPMFSAFERVRSKSTCPGSTRTGPSGAATARTYGDSSNSRAFAAVFGWSRNGPHAGDRRTRLTLARSVALLRPEPSPVL
jgi:Transposase